MSKLEEPDFGHLYLYPHNNKDIMDEFKLKASELLCADYPFGYDLESEPKALSEIEILRREFIFKTMFEFQSEAVLLLFGNDTYLGEFSLNKEVLTKIRELVERIKAKFSKKPDVESIQSNVIHLCERNCGINRALPIKVLEEMLELIEKTESSLLKS